MSRINLGSHVASRQLGFHQLLVAARNTWLSDALAAALADVDPREVKIEIVDLVPIDVQQILAAAGIRDELVFPTKTLLRKAPSLVGYYRLLLGLPQKTFYGGETGVTAGRNMELRGIINKRQTELLAEFCAAMTPPLSELVRQMSPAITLRDVAELPLLTLGSQFQGANNNLIGQKATVDVFRAIMEIVLDYTESQTAAYLSIRNAAGRLVRITLASDPDLAVTETIGNDTRRKVAIEIKGGTDRSNAHNRAGEAEKSHQKAKTDGFKDFWTIIAKQGLDMRSLQGGSPTTTEWYDISHVLAREGSDWDRFKRDLTLVVGIAQD